MATSKDDEGQLGQDLENIGKTLNASATINKIASEMVGIKETLESTKKESENIDYNGPYLREFLRALSKTIDFADGLCSFAKTMGTKHSECVEAFKNMIKIEKITSEQIGTMEKNFNDLLKVCEDFEDKMNEFLESLDETHDKGEIASTEIKREEERLNAEAAETLSKAEKARAGQWAKKIFTFGLITLSSSFQDDVDANEKQYKEVRRLKTLAQRFKKAHQDLDNVVTAIDKVKNRVERGPIKLTKEMIDTIRHVIQMYAAWTNMTNKLDEQETQLLKQQNKIYQQSTVITEKDDEIERLKVELAKAKKEK